MTLIQKQGEFSLLVARLIQRAAELGYTVTLGEAWRPAVTASYYAAMGQGIKNSLHTRRLAIDINLFRGTTYLTHSEDYSGLGQWWMDQSTDDYELAWGGMFKRVDIYHFSMADGGQE